MKLLTFVAGSGVRKVKIDGNLIYFYSSETGFHPITLDLDKLQTPEMESKLNKMKLGEEDRKLLFYISQLEDEDKKAQDIIKDFQSSGWRLIKKE